MKREMCTMLPFGTFQRVTDHRLWTIGRYISLHLFVVFLSSAVLADDLTLFFQNPWRNEAYPDNQCVLRVASTYSGWQGQEMTDQGNGLFSVTFTGVDRQHWQYEQELRFTLDCYTQDWTYDRGLSPKSIFGASATSAWVMVPNSSAAPQITTTPPETRYIQILNPWPDASPRIIVSPDNSPIRMAPNADHCGWYGFTFVGDISDIKVKFQNVLGGDLYGADGFSGGAWIDLADVVASSDTAWIRTRMDVAAKPELVSLYPYVDGECGFRILSALVRDWPGKSSSPNTGFLNDLKQNFNFGPWGDFTPGMVENRLDADGRLVKGSKDCYSSHLDYWFKTFPPSELYGHRNDTCIELMLTKDDEGYWTYSSGNNGFFPIDDFNHPYFNSILNGEGNYRDGGQMIDASGRVRNFSFTMEMHTEFPYHEGTGQTFFFSGDDDVWVFINSQLVIDLGGVHGRMEHMVNLDESQAALGLENGKIYSLDMFYCERKTNNSNFEMRTNLALSTHQAFFYEDTVLDASARRIQYDFFEIKEMTSEACGVNIVDAVPGEAAVDFFLEGPEFQGAKVRLDAGTTHYGGIVIPGVSTNIVIDSTALTGKLARGEYLLTFQSKDDPDKVGRIPFYVGGDPSAGLSADPVTGSRFGEQLVVTLTTNPNAEIYYTTDGSAPSKTGQGSTESATVTVTNPGDTVTIKAIAAGDSYVDKEGTFVYYRQYVPKVSADPASCTFGRELNVSLSVDLASAVIYYTRDGSDPDQSSTQYDGAEIRLSETTTIKARAYATDYVPGGIMSETYTRVSGILAAYYFDTNADGRIDHAEIHLDMQRSRVPSQVILQSPFDENERATVSSGIRWKGDSPSTLCIEVDLDSPFKFGGSTGFSPEILGWITSPVDSFDTSGFVIADSVAPVIRSASYLPGGFVSDDPAVQDRDPDTLEIEFTENVEAITESEPFRFVTSSGTEYQVQVTPLWITGSTYRFVVDTVIGVKLPQDGDSLRLAVPDRVSKGVTDLLGNEQTDANNRRVAIDVTPPPYRALIGYLTPIDPRNPEKHSFPQEIRNLEDLSVKSGAFGIINLQTELTPVEIEKLRASCVIYDAVGNLVASCGSLEENNGSLDLAVGTTDEGETKMYWVWDGRNSKGRHAGSGNYLLIYQYTDHRGDSRVERMVVGVEG